MKRTNVRPLGALFLAGALLAGCGGTTTKVTSGTGSSGLLHFQHQVVAFASCMRSHGVPDYPDPQFTSGGVRISPGRANPNSPAFRTADGACHRLLPSAGAPGGAVSAQAKAQDVKFADCMRAHGVPNFPDPSHDGGFDLPPGLHPNAPRFEQAEQACASVQPSSLSINANPS